VYATGLATFDHEPGAEFMELLVEECLARGLQDFNPQELANVLSGGTTGPQCQHLKFVVISAVA
jgi:hypothetical protein